MEKITGLTTEIVHYIVPGALPYAGTFQKVVPLEQEGLYSFALVDAPGDGLDLDEDVGTYVRSNRDTSVRSSINRNLTNPLLNIVSTFYYC